MYIELLKLHVIEATIGGEHSLEKGLTEMQGFVFAPLNQLFIMLCISRTYWTYFCVCPPRFVYLWHIGSLAPELLSVHETWTSSMDLLLHRSMPADTHAHYRMVKCCVCHEITIWIIYYSYFESTNDWEAFCPNTSCFPLTVIEYTSCTACPGCTSPWVWNV